MMTQDKACALAIFIVLSTPSAQAASAGLDAPATCAPMVRNMSLFAAQIARGADAYWMRRKAYAELAGRPARTLNANQKTWLVKTMSQGGEIKQATISALANFAGLVAAAQAQNCLKAGEAQAMRETTFAAAKRVNIDKFPSNGPIENVTADTSSPKMPR